MVQITYTTVVIPSGSITTKHLYSFTSFKETEYNTVFSLNSLEVVTHDDKCDPLTLYY